MAHVRNPQTTENLDTANVCRHSDHAPPVYLESHAPLEWECPVCGMKTTVYHSGSPCTC